MDEIQIVVPGVLVKMVRELLESRGFRLYTIPVVDDLPTYGIDVA